MPAMKKKILNLYACARELDVPVGWLKEMADLDRIPCLRIGKRIVRFNPEAVREAIAELAATNNINCEVKSD
jgi:L-lysine 2,3-aminomutase